MSIAIFIIFATVLWVRIYMLLVYDINIKLNDATNKY